MPDCHIGGLPGTRQCNLTGVPLRHRALKPRSFRDLATVRTIPAAGQCALLRLRAEPVVNFELFCLTQPSLWQHPARACCSSPALTRRHMHLGARLASCLSAGCCRSCLITVHRLALAHAGMALHLPPTASQSPRLGQLAASQRRVQKRRNQRPRRRIVWRVQKRPASRLAALQKWS